GRPLKVIVPRWGLTTPVITLNSVVLPAPFGPMRPVTLWGAIVSPTSESAARPPNRTVTPSTSIRGEGAVGAMKPLSVSAEPPRLGPRGYTSPHTNWLACGEVTSAARRGGTEEGTTPLTIKLPMTWITWKWSRAEPVISPIGPCTAMTCGVKIIQIYLVDCDRPTPERIVPLPVRTARFTDRVALVTGAAGGIGAATAQRLAAEGAAVVLTDIDTERG